MCALNVRSVSLVALLSPRLSMSVSVVLKSLLTRCQTERRSSLPHVVLLCSPLLAHSLYHTPFWSVHLTVLLRRVSPLPLCNRFSSQHIRLSFCSDLPLQAAFLLALLGPALPSEHVQEVSRLIIHFPAHTTFEHPHLTASVPRVSVSVFLRLNS